MIASDRSRVAMLVSPKTIELREEAVPPAPQGGIVVRVRAALTDGTDLKTYRRGHPKMPLPTRFGHEFSGDVAAVAPGVIAFAAGDPVMCVHTAPCGQCYWCRNGQWICFIERAERAGGRRRADDRQCRKCDMIAPPHQHYVEAAL